MSICNSTICQCPLVQQFTAHKQQALMCGRNAFHIGNLLLQCSNCLTEININRSIFSRKSPHSYVSLHGSNKWGRGRWRRLNGWGRRFRPTDTHLYSSSNTSFFSSSSRLMRREVARSHVYPRTASFAFLPWLRRFSVSIRYSSIARQIS